MSNTSQYRIVFGITLYSISILMVFGPFIMFKVSRLLEEALENKPKRITEPIMYEEWRKLLQNTKLLAIASIACGIIAWICIARFLLRRSAFNFRSFFLFVAVLYTIVPPSLALTYVNLFKKGSFLRPNKQESRVSATVKDAPLVRHNTPSSVSSSAL